MKVVIEIESIGDLWYHNLIKTRTHHAICRYRALADKEINQISDINIEEFGLMKGVGKTTKRELFEIQKYFASIKIKHKRIGHQRKPNYVTILCPVLEI